MKVGRLLMFCASILAGIAAHAQAGSTCYGRDTDLDVAVRSDSNFVGHCRLPQRDVVLSFVRNQASLGPARAVETLYCDDQKPAAVKELKQIPRPVGEFALIHGGHARVSPAAQVAIGDSIGRPEGDARGTLGAIVYRGAEPYLLGNAHVLAPDRATGPVGGISDEILDPGPRPWAVPVSRETGGAPCFAGAAFVDCIGRLERAERIYFAADAMNRIDAAIAEIDEPQNCVAGAYPDGHYAPTGDIKTIGAIRDGDRVTKYGASTGRTFGTIRCVSDLVRVRLGDDEMAYFRDQIVIEDEDPDRPFSAPGDSGALVVLVDSPGAPVGLLFARSDFEGFSLANPIESVLCGFGATTVSGVDAAPCDCPSNSPGPTAGEAAARLRVRIETDDVCAFYSRVESIWKVRVLRQEQKGIDPDEQDGYPIEYDPP